MTAQGKIRNDNQGEVSSFQSVGQLRERYGMATRGKYGITTKEKISPFSRNDSAKGDGLRDELAAFPPTHRHIATNRRVIPHKARSLNIFKLVQAQTRSV